MAKLLAAPTKNAIQKTLASQLLSSAGLGDPITFDDVDGIPNLPGVLVVRRIDANNAVTPDFREYIEYSGTSGNTVLITTRNVDGSNSALTHPAGSIVEFIPDITWADRIYDALATVIDVNDVSAVNTTNIVTLTGTQTLTNKTLTSPKIGTAISDTNGNELIKLTATSAAVNEVTLANGASGSDVSLSATGDDTNIGFKIKAKGTGKVKIGTAELQFPNADGSANQVLKTDGSGVLSFTSASSGFSTDIAVGSTPDPTTTSTSYADMNEMSITFTSTNGVAVVMLTCTTYNSSALNANFVALKMDTDGEVGENYVSDASGAVATAIYRWTGLSAGSHTVKGRWKVGAGTGTLAGARRYMTVLYN